MDTCKVVLIGAGSASFTAGLVGDLLSAASGPQGQGRRWAIGLVDINEEALGVSKGLVERMVQKVGASVKVEASTDRREVLPGAEFVVCTIAVGGRKAWEDDVLIPLAHGVHQPVGDTVMAGGISRALRQIPPMVEIAHDVHRLCPQAMLFNYSNPMAAICRAVNKATPAQVVGLCHGVQGTVRYLCEVAGVAYEEVEAHYVGMNHLTWITHLSRDGADLWGQVRERRAASGAADNPFSWELFEAYGAFPAVLDRHVTEFFPERFAGGDYYGQRLGVEVMNVVTDAIRGGQEHYERMRRMATGEDELAPGLLERNLGEHEALVPILLSVLGDRREVFPMNIPNRHVKGIPEDFVLEVPVMASRAGCLPVGIPEPPAAVRAWTTEALYGVELTVEAALSGCRDAFVQALLYDRCVPDLRAARALADALLEAHKAHLPRFG